jgi:hypothetical protein
MKKKTHTILLFLKFGSEENILDLYENGTIYMNTISWFKAVDDNYLRGDTYEGLSKIMNYPKGKFRIESLNHEVNYEKLQIRHANKDLLGNIYSLFCVSSFFEPTPENFKIDKRVEEFGSHCLIIKNCPKFLSLIEAKLTFLGYEYDHDFVEYYDKDKINGNIDFFHKREEFRYQNEFRFLVYNDKKEPIKFQIGCLKDISEVVKSEDAKHLKLESKK